MEKWITEKDAAEMVGRKPRTLRNLVKKGAWKVEYSALNGRGFKYSRKDIESLIKAASKKQSNERSK